VNRLIASAVAVLGAGAIAMACGPRPGDPCSGEVYRCDTGTAALECRDAGWVSVPCKGTNGCKYVLGGVTCDITLNAEGEGCPTELEGTGYCRAAPTAMMVCQNRAIVKASDCSTCTAGTQVVCTP
jgi:hypothetical protein